MRTLQDKIAHAEHAADRSTSYAHRERDSRSRSPTANDSHANAVADYDERIESLRKSHMEQMAEVERKLDLKADALDAAQKEILSIREENDRMRHAESEMRSGQESLASDLHGSQTRIASIETELKLAQAELDRTSAQLEEANRRCDSLQGEVITLEI